MCHREKSLIIDFHQYIRVSFLKLLLGNVEINVELELNSNIPESSS